MLDVVAQIAQTALGLCFGFAAIAKLKAFRRFEEGVASFEVVNPSFNRLAAIAVVALELMVAGTFISGFSVHFGVALSILLLAIFMAVTVSLELRGHIAVCMCFGGVGEQFNVRRVLVRFVLVGVGVGIVWIDLRYSPSPSPVPWWTTTVAATCTLAACAAAEGMLAMWESQGT